MYSSAVSYYHEQLNIVLDGFGYTLSDISLPENLPEFTSLLQRSLVLEFLIVTVIKPIVSIPVRVMFIESLCAN